MIEGLIKPVRAVSFSPGVKLLAAAGDAKSIALYEVESGERVAILTGHASWIFTLDWNDSGEHLLSGYVLHINLLLSQYAISFEYRN